MKLLIIITALLILSCTKENRDTEIQPARPKTKIELKAVNDIQLNVTGRIGYLSSVTYRIPTNGTIDTVHVSISDTVKTGDTLISLQLESIISEERFQQAKLSAAQKDKIRINTLYKKGAKTAIENEKAEQQYFLESAKMKKLKTLKDQHYIRALSPGIIGSAANLSRNFYESGDTILVVNSIEKIIKCQLPHIWSEINFDNAEITAYFPGDTAITITEFTTIIKETGIEFSTPLPTEVDNQRTSCAITIRSKSDSGYIITGYGPNKFQPGDIVSIKSNGKDHIFQILSSGNDIIRLLGERGLKDLTVESLSLF